MTKLLVVSIQSSGGGAETVLKNLQAAIESEGAPIHLTTLSKHSFDRGNSSNKFFGYIRFLRQVRALARQSDYVMSGLEGIPYLLCAAAVVGLARPRLVLWLHCAPRSYLPFQNLKGRMAIRASLLLANRVVCAAPLEAPRLAKAGKHTVYLPNFRRAVSRGPAQPSAIFARLVFVGSFSQLKQPEKCVDVMQGLHSRSKKDGYTLDMYGVGPLAQQLHDQVLAAHLQGSVTFHGFVSEPWDDIRPGSVLLLPSLTEAMPMVVLEAFERGCVVIANPFEGASFFEDHAGLFIAAPFSDLNVVLDAIAIARSWSPSELTQRAYNSHRFLTEKFDAAKSLTQLGHYLEAGVSS